jgi:hypothetical protein
VPIAPGYQHTADPDDLHAADQDRCIPASIALSSPWMMGQLVICIAELNFFQALGSVRPFRQVIAWRVGNMA